MKAITQNGILVITLSGRIDANNAQEVEQQLLEAIRGKEDVPLQLDMEELNYLSSVGLRVLLRLQKGRKEKIRMLRVRPKVYEILQLTGFTELFDVNRQLREVTVEACPIIGQGANGTVYRLEEDKILKLYRPGHTLEEIDRERRLAREAFISGIPSVITYDTVRCGESYGIVFERMKSDTLGHAFADGKKEIGELVQRYVDFFRTLHQIPIKPGTFPELKDSLHQKVPPLAAYGTEEQLKLLHRLVDSIPDSDTLVHGDLHPGNIMLQDGELLLIDLPGASIGSKAWDLVALFSDLIIGPRQIPTVIEKSTGIPADLAVQIGRDFFRRYFELEDDAALQQIIGMMMPLFALNTVLTFGNPESPSRFLSGEIVQKMLREAIEPNEAAILDALQELSQ